MNTKSRSLVLDVFDYSGNKICSLYDNSADISGQASNVVVLTERNGWRELSFQIPSTCQTEDGDERNYRLDCLKADYRIRLIDDSGTDWFLISEPKITHSAFSKNVQVTAGHISQLLKTKNLGLEFSDKEGNNVGTASEILAVILKGTGWKAGNVATFYEKDGKTVKSRSLKAPAKTGAFKLISNMCDLFEAKPIYHGDSKTVDILPLNPFSEPEDGELPDVAQADGVLELHYGKNVTNITRTLNTENIVTKLYAYGAYGTKTYGYCGIDECEHTEYRFTVHEDLASTKSYDFTIKDDEDTDITYRFTPTSTVAKGSVLVYSLLDPASMMYVWDESSSKAYPTVKGRITSSVPLNADAEKISMRNWFSFIMDYDYYREIGLLSDEMIDKIANYQRYVAADKQAIYDMALSMADNRTVLSETIGSVNFCRLAVKAFDTTSPYVSLELNVDDYKHGVMYRTDYDQKEKDYFKWNKTDELDKNGNSKNEVASPVYIIHDTTPISWDKAYVRAFDNEDEPTVITLWKNTADTKIDLNNDRIFLFETNNINGWLGAFEAKDEAVLESLESLTTIVTTKHPVYFETEKKPIDMEALHGYGWLWLYHFDGEESSLYFCYADENDTDWKPVYFTSNMPNNTKAVKGSYWFDWDAGALYRGASNQWVKLDTTAEKRVAAQFGSIYRSCKSRDQYYQGLSEFYTYTTSTSLPAGNYYFKNDFGTLWVFSTPETCDVGTKLIYDTTDGWLTIDDGKTQTALDVKSYRFDNVNYHLANILKNITMEPGCVNLTNGTVESNNARCISSVFFRVYPNTKYTFSGMGSRFDIISYNDKKRFVSSKTFSSQSSGTYTTAGDVHYIKVSLYASTETTSNYAPVMNADGYSTKIIIDDETYTLLDPLEKSGDTKSIPTYVSKLAEYADVTFLSTYGELIARQEDADAKEEELITSIGDIYREGYWQKDDYVDGDESKLYDDALDNLLHIAKPEASYSITFLDLYASNNQDSSYGFADEASNIAWPDISIASAVHLVDADIGVNTWAFIDKINKCYDQPWKTTLSINTNLSTISQHSFADVMTNIAQVASEMKGKVSKYDAQSSTSAETSSFESNDASVLSWLSANTESDLTSGSFALITGNQIGAATITGENIAPGAIDGSALGTSVITSANIQDAAITNAKIENAAITSAKIENAAITSAKIVDAAITSAKIESAAITSAKIQNAAITSAKIHDAAITSAKIEDAAITSAKIEDAAITNAKIQNAAITGAKIGNATIETANIKLGAITSVLIGEAAINTTQIADGSITDAKVVDLTGNKITAGTICADRLILRGSDQSVIYAINNMGELVSEQVDTIDGDVLTERSVCADKIVAGSITANEIAAKAITANHILAGAITSEKIAADSINASHIEAHTINADCLSSDVGSSLNLSSNESIKLMAGEIDKLSYRIEVTATTDVLSNANSTTTLTAKVYDGADDITDQLSSKGLSIAWRCLSNNSAFDADFASNVTNNTVTLAAEKVPDSLQIYADLCEESTTI